MEYKKEITVTKTFVQCDCCEKTTEQRDVWIMSCAVCGKDVCNNHPDAESNEDGCLCPECSKIYEFDGDDCSIGVVSKETGLEVKAPYL